jgi:hypothetical protein
MSQNQPEVFCHSEKKKKANYHRLGVASLAFQRNSDTQNSLSSSDISILFLSSKLTYVLSRNKMVCTNGQLSLVQLTGYQGISVMCCVG